MRHPKLLLALCAIFLLAATTEAQEMSWRKHRKLAERLEKEGDYYAAAENYRMAWEKKQSKEELIYRAAENYFRLRDYRNAADAYQHVPANFADDQLVSLKYARSLKQDAQYDKARTVFRELADSYTGPDKAILQDIVAAELRGLDLTRELTGSMDRRMEILHPGVNVNTESEEFGVVPIDPTTAYFTSTMGGEARIYSTQRVGRAWSKAETPAGFPVVEGGQFGHGSMSADQQRFYFTICNNDNGWDGANTRCEIYITRQSANGWTKPERLPDFVNVKGINTTHPAVAQMAGQEYLFFASNREGGRGGLDLWYVVRDLGVDNLDFTFPINLGPAINTLGDEVTPFYSAEEGALYFSSNGQPSIGGHDIFKSVGSEVNWQTPVNVGLPLNSSADDTGYTQHVSGVGGFFSSNRAFGGEKTNTRNTDIFEFTIGGQQITLKSNVYAQASAELLPNISVSLYQLFEDGTENLLITKDFPSGSYLFELLPNRRFRVEVKHDGYETGGYVFATDDPATFTYGQPLFLNADETIGIDNGGMMSETEGTEMVDTPVIDDPSTPIDIETPDNSATFINEGEQYTAKGTSAKDNLSYSSTAPRHGGTYFRIQVAALRKFDTNNSRFANLGSYGPLYTEELSDRNLTRVLVGDFFSNTDAQDTLRDIRGQFPEAYIVKYDDGVRYGRVNF